MLNRYASNIINPLCEDLEKKLKLYSNVRQNESLNYDFEQERYIKIAKIIVNQHNLDIEKMINMLPKYYKNRIFFNNGKISLDGREFSCISSQIYKQLYYIDEKSAFTQYLTIVQNKLVGDLNCFFELSFDSESIKEHFLNEATQYIIEHQNSSWIDEFEKVDYQKYSWFKSIEIDKIPKNFDTNEDLYFWLKNNEQVDTLNFLGSELLNSLLRVVVQYDSYNIHSHSFNKNGIVKILEECKNDYILIGQILTSQDIRLNIFFLHFFEYSLFGFLNLYELDSAPHKLQSKKINYTQEWNELITKQLNDIFFLHFSSIYNKDNFSTVISYIINYMAKDYVSNFSNNYATNQKRKEVFQYFLESVSTCEIIIGQYEKTLLIEYCINDLVSKQVERLDTNQLDLSSYYLLVLYAKQIVRIEKLFDKDHNDLISIIINSLIEDIKTIFTNNLQDDRLYFKVDTLKIIDFPFLYEVSVDKKQWYSLIDIDEVKSRWLEEKSIQKSHSSQDSIEPKNIVKLYFYILMKIYQNHQEEEIASLLNQLAIEFGLNIDLGIFHETSWMGHQFTEKSFIEYIKILNTFNDDLFNSFLECLVEKEQLRDLLELLNYTEIEERKRIVRSKINDIYEKLDIESLSSYDIRESILYAQYNDFNDLATKFINLYQEKVSKNKNQNKYKEKEFLEIVCKKELLDIVNDKSLSLDDKFTKLQQYNNPFNDRNYGVESKQIKCENYKDFIRAILFFETKPLHTYKILSELVEKELNSLYLINMLNAYFRAYEEDEHKKVKYKYILEKYEEYDKRFSNREKSLYEYQVLLYGYLSVDNEIKFTKLWFAMPQKYQYDMQILEVRCEFLQKNYQSLKAKEYIEKFKKRFSLTSNELERIKDIEEKINDDIVIEVENKLSIKIDLKSLDLTLREAKNSWLQIKDMTSEEHSQIFSKSKDLSDFIKNIMLDISKELLNRKMNILRQIEQKLEIEDIINDWVKSLFEQKMSFLNWHTKDQTRGGKSSSQKSIGEKDLEVYNASNEKLFLFEAFRLCSINRSTIEEHINKLDGYNADGCQIIIIMSYCKVKDFVKLCTSYKDILLTLDYKGFDETKNNKNSFDNIEAKSSTIKIFKEIRYKNSIPITLYHFLLDFE